MKIEYKAITFVIICILFLIGFTFIIDSEPSIGDIHYYEYTGILAEVYYPDNYTLGDWCYGPFIQIRLNNVDTGRRINTPNFTHTKINLNKYINRTVHLWCSGCCFEDSIDKLEVIN